MVGQSPAFPRPPASRHHSRPCPRTRSCLQTTPKRTAPCASGSHCMRAKRSEREARQVSKARGLRARNHASSSPAPAPCSAAPCSNPTCCAQLHRNAPLQPEPPPREDWNQTTQVRKRGTHRSEEIEMNPMNASVRYWDKRKASTMRCPPALEGEEGAQQRFSAFRKRPGNLWWCV
mgnify:CR=1 FL=1